MPQLAARTFGAAKNFSLTDSRVDSAESRHGRELQYGKSYFPLPTRRFLPYLPPRKAYVFCLLCGAGCLGPEETLPQLPKVISDLSHAVAVPHWILLRSVQLGTPQIHTRPTCRALLPGIFRKHRTTAKTCQ